MSRYPERIICLTEETVETLYLLGQDHRIVAVTGYAVRPARVRREKPRVGAFTSADIPKILSHKPDLVLTFSDLQADIAAELIRKGITVLAFNQRRVKGILDMIATLGRLTGAEDRAQRLIDAFTDRRAGLRPASPRPKVYFEEWDDPMIASIGWASDLIGIAGGEDIFAHLSHQQAATDRIVTLEQVIAANPDIIIGSWCGKKLNPARIAARPGWDAIKAVQNGRIHEIKSPLILAPGPAALTDGLDALVQIIEEATPC
ncbi:cobalamin-binding protein [Tropicibacter alexandrii]|uniref:cobalamin-binding protein n=1 Tax=Tropicibacter alexandrii TaxID=2267683 RepID=UPI0010092E1F|nr:cobalamin-binding protein [Tropicibacter alexandrii]